MCIHNGVSGRAIRCLLYFYLVWRGPLGSLQERTSKGKTESRKKQPEYKSLTFCRWYYVLYKDRPSVLRLVAKYTTQIWSSIEAEDQHCKIFYFFLCKDTSIHQTKSQGTTRNRQRREGVGKYLGLPEHFSKKKRDLFASIVDKIHQKSVSYSSRFLSTACRATMLQPVLSPIPSFAMTCFELPVGLCKQIQSELTKFWWNSKEGERKICWTSWDKLTLPKKLGGLGFRDIQLFNQALLAKIG